MNIFKYISKPDEIKFEAPHWKNYSNSFPEGEEVICPDIHVLLQYPVSQRKPTGY